MNKQSRRKSELGSQGNAQRKPRRLSSAQTIRALDGVIHEPLPDRIRALREMCGYSEHAVAVGIGISQPTYHLVEAGVTRLSLARLSELAEFYRVPLARLAQGYEMSPTEAKTVNAAPHLREPQPESAVA